MTTSRKWLCAVGGTLAALYAYGLTLPPRSAGPAQWTEAERARFRGRIAEFDARNRVAVETHRVARPVPPVLSPLPGRHISGPSGNLPAEAR